MTVHIDLYNKELAELYENEISSIHLDATSISPIKLKSHLARSTMSFAMEEIRAALQSDRTKSIIPLIGMVAILEQLGNCYSDVGIESPNLENGIKRALYYFGNFEPTDKTIKLLYAFRNGLVHDLSLLSKNPKDGTENYVFGYDYELPELFRSATEDWNGNMDDIDHDKNTTSINPTELLKLVTRCVNKANEAKKAGTLEIRLAGGAKEILSRYIRIIPKDIKGEAKELVAAPFVKERKNV